jgi:hypothetical protein
MIFISTLLSAVIVSIALIPMHNAVALRYRLEI